jgi:N-acyl-D-amino-acid deacylase
MADRWLRIYGGTVIDDTGQPPRLADVLVRNNRIVTVGGDALPGETPPLDGMDSIDATGMTIMPGPIDVHCRMT